MCWCILSVPCEVMLANYPKEDVRQKMGEDGSMSTWIETIPLEAAVQILSLHYGNSNIS